MILIIVSRISSHCCQNGLLQRHPRWSADGVFTSVANARFVAVLGPRNHILQTMRELHWLPIRSGIDCKFGMMMHAVVYGTAPEYMRIKVTPFTDLSSCRHIRRCAASGLFHVPRRRTRCGSCAFSVAGPKSIRDCTSVAFLNKQLKTQFFNLAHTLPLN